MQTHIIMHLFIHISYANICVLHIYIYTYSYANSYVYTHIHIHKPPATWRRSVHARSVMPAVLHYCVARVLRSQTSWASGSAAVLTPMDLYVRTDGIVISFHNTYVYVFIYIHIYMFVNVCVSTVAV